MGSDSLNQRVICIVVISIHATRVGSDVGNMKLWHFVSIHAAHAGGDMTSRRVAQALCISIHTTRAGSDAGGS